jgi:hypothetical protein
VSLALRQDFMLHLRLLSVVAELWIGGLPALNQTPHNCEREEHHVSARVLPFDVHAATLALITNGMGSKEL